jgi:hypothetical protein
MSGCCVCRDGKGLDCLPEAVRCAAVCSGDKAVDVREASTSLMTTLIEVRILQAQQPGLHQQPVAVLACLTDAWARNTWELG